MLPAEVAVAGVSPLRLRDERGHDAQFRPPRRPDLHPTQGPYLEGALPFAANAALLLAPHRRIAFAMMNAAAGAWASCTECSTKRASRSSRKQPASRRDQPID